MAGVLVKRRHVEWRQTGAQRKMIGRPREKTASDWSEVSASRGTPGLPVTTCDGKRQEGSAPRASRSRITLLTLDLRFLASRL